MLTNIAKLSYPKLDIISVIFISFALIGILYGLSTIFMGNILLAVSAILLGIILSLFFIFRQKKLEDPLINLEPMQVKPFALGVILNMLALLIIFAMNIVTPMFFTRQLGGFRIAILSDLVSGNFTFLYLFTFGRPNLR